MRKTGTYYLIISLILFSLFTLFVIFSFSQESAAPKVNEVTPLNPLRQTQPFPSPSPVSLPAETHDYRSIEKLEEENPWIKLVPMVGDDFITRYDYETGAIEIVIYTQQGTKKFSEDEIKMIKSTVETTLIQRGINLNSVKITARVE